MDNTENQNPSTSEAKVSKSMSSGGEKLAWASGGFAENLAMNVFPSLSFNIFQIGMGVSPVVISIATSASKFIEGFSDTFFGNLSDNTRSKWGRRRPWIFFGAFILALTFIAIWFTPRTPGLMQTVYFITIVSLFYIVMAIWQMPYGALGLELEEDYTERTKLQTYKSIFSYVIGILIGSAYLICQLDFMKGSGNEVDGARKLGIIVGILIIIFGVIPAIFCKEKNMERTQAQKKDPFWPSLVVTFKSKPFLLLMGSLFFVYVALFFMLPLLGYISMYHVCSDGMHSIFNWTWRHPFTFTFEESFVTHKELAGHIGVYTAILQPATQILMVIIVNRIAKFFDKRTLLILGSTVAILGYVSSWFLFTPSAPFLAVFPPVIINMGLAMCWPLIGSFTADICDYDEYEHGSRREGMFTAVSGFLIKLAIALVSIIAGYVLVLVGIDGANPIISVEDLNLVRQMYVWIPTVSMLLTIVLIWRYPLSKEKVQEIQEKLRERAAAKAASVESNN